MHAHSCTHMHTHAHTKSNCGYFRYMLNVWSLGALEIVDNNITLLSLTFDRMKYTVYVVLLGITELFAE